jgi:hypothetical protein
MVSGSRFNSIFCSVMTLLGFVALSAGCSMNGNVTDLSSLVSAPITAVPTTPSNPTPNAISVSSKDMTFTAGPGKKSGLPTTIAGGTPPYNYAIVSGPGSIDAATGVFTHPFSWQPTVVRISDSAGQSTTVNIINTPMLTDGQINAMALSGSDLFIAGTFTSIFPDYRPGFAIVNTTNGALTNALCNYKAKFYDAANTGAGTGMLQYGDYLIFYGVGATKFNDIDVNGVVKFNYKTCELDTTFNAKAKTISFSGIYAAAVDASTNSLYLTGEITSYDSIPTGSNEGGFLKIDLVTGQLDTAFTQTTAFNTYVKKLLVSGNFIYAVGSFYLYRGSPAAFLAKINKTTGALDTTFTQSPVFNGDASRAWDLTVLNGSVYVAIQSDGAPTYRGVAVSELVKLDETTGNLDTTFSQSPGFGWPYKVNKIATDGSSLYVGGEFDTYRGVSCPRLIKLDAVTGVMDASFTWGTGATGGGGFFPFFDSVSQAVFVAYNPGSDAYNGIHSTGLIKIDKTSGAYDAAFSSQLAVPSSSPRSLVFLTDGSLVLPSPTFYAGGSPSRGIAKINLNTWSVDSSFNPGTGFGGGDVKSMLVTGGSVYLGGTFTSYNGQNAIRLAKISASTGALDTTFTQSTGAAGVMGPSVTSLATDGVGGIYVCGSFSTYRGTTAPYLIRVSSTNGNLDNTFFTFPGLSSGACASIAYGNSSIYATGAFATYRGTTVGKIAKINGSSGVLDATFTQTTGLAGGNGTSLILNGTDLYVAGAFTTYRGGGTPYLIKVDASSGNIDATFSQANSANASLSIFNLLGGQIFATLGSATSITSYRSQAANNLLSISPTDGSLASAYQVSSGPNGAVSGAVTYLGKTYIGGAFTSYKGASAKYFMIIDGATGAQLDP